PILTQQFTATTSGITWSVDGVVGGNATSGTISTNGLYTPPSASGTHTITGTSSTPVQSVNATAYVSNYPGTYTRDFDKLRTGLNPSETVLTPTNVNAVQFGKLFSNAIDGTADASPLYVPSVNISGVLHNVVYVATEHDSVYAFDADGRQTAPLWQRSFINPSSGITSVPPGDTGECSDISPEIGITGTPIIDTSTNPLYFFVNTNGVRVTGGGQGAGVWQSGDGLATDSTGNIFFVTGNGIFDVNTGGPDYGDSFVKLSTSGQVLDYFTPHDQQNMNDLDIDLGSGG